MTCWACGSEWFLEQRVIRPVTPLPVSPYLPITPREVVFRLTCADCGQAVQHDSAVTANTASSATKQARRGKE